MKTINSIRLILSIIALAAFMLVLKSCKKTDVDAPNNNSAATAKAAATQALKARDGNASPGLVLNVNKEADEVLFKDEAGNMVPFITVRVAGQPPIFDCHYTCSNTNDPNNLHIMYDLQSLQRIYNCENTTQSDLIATWIISAPFTPLVADPNNASNLSSGSIKIVTSSGAANSWVNLRPITIKNLGADPRCSTNNFYLVSYTANGISTNYFDNITSLGVSMILYNNCPITGNVTIPSVTQLSSSTLLNLAGPCERVDRVGFILPGLFTYTQAAGNTVICNLPIGLTPIDFHQLEYRKVNSPTGSLAWDDQTSTSFWGRTPSTNASSAILSPNTFLNLIQMTANTGTWLVRYRNVKTGTCNVINNTGFPNEPWGNPVYWFTEVVTP